MTDEDLLQSTSSTTTYLTVESDQAAMSSTTPRVDLTHTEGYKLDISEEKVGVTQPAASQDSDQVTMDETLTLQDSPAPLNPEPTQEIAAEEGQTGPDMVDITHNKRPEPSAPDNENTIEERPFINSEAVSRQEALSEPGQSKQSELVASPSNELQLTVSESPRPLVRQITDQQFKAPHQENLRSPRPTPVQTETHLLSPEDPLTNSPTASNPNTPDSQEDHMANVGNVVATEVDAPSKIPQLPAIPVHEALPNPFEFLPPISTPWNEIARPHSASGFSRHRDDRPHRLPSVLRPANRHHFDTEGSRRASMVAGWDFTPPTLFPPGNQLSPRDRTVSLEVMRQEPHNLPSRPQSSASWYPRYHRINSQPVYVENYHNGYPHPHHQRLSSQPAYLSSGSSSFADLHGAATPELQYTPSRQSSGRARNSERDENELPEAVPAMISVNETEAELEPELPKEQENETMMDGHDKMTKPCPDQSKQRWKFWSRNRHSQCLSEPEPSKLSVPAPADARLKLKKRLSRNLLKKTN